MRRLILALCLLPAVVFLPVKALAEEGTLCGQRSSDYIQSNGAALEGQWTLTWTKGLLTVAGTNQVMQDLPPAFDFDLSLDGTKLFLRGQTVKRDFAIEWDDKVLANFDPPSNDPAYGQFLDTDETEVLMNCKIKDTPYLRGTSVSPTGSKVGETDLHLWLFSSDQMLGLSVAENGSAVARMMFVMTRKK